MGENGKLRFFRTTSEARFKTDADKMSSKADENRSSLKMGHVVCKLVLLGACWDNFNQS